MAMEARENEFPPADLRAAVERLTWYHTLELAPGVVTDGLFDHRPYVERYGLPADLRGTRALDVGALDGFWSFELERRGARVTALDVEGPEALDWPPRLRAAGERRGQAGFPLAQGEAFGLARRVLGSSVERVVLSLYDATPQRLGGTFDLVFCGSVLMHLRDPMLALERMAGLCSRQLVLAEEYSRRLELLPRALAAEFRGESPWMTWWIPTSRTWLSMVRCAGFEDVRRHGRFRMRFRSQRGAIPHAVIHARGTA
jgi:tRNA (mo5U34)-methyltransferase